MEIQVRLFAMLREAAGRDSLSIELPDGATVADALEAIAGEPGLEELIGRLPVRAAVNREYASDGAALSAGDELALIPPVSGGAGPPEGHARGGDAPLALEEGARAVGRPGAGAVVAVSAAHRAEAFAGARRAIDRIKDEAPIWKREVTGTETGVERRWVEGAE